MSIDVLPLGVVNIDVLSTQTGFQSILNCIERIGVSSSSGFVLPSLLGMSPRSKCRQNFVAVSFSVFHLLT